MSSHLSLTSWLSYTPFTGVDAAVKYVRIKSIFGFRRDTKRCLLTSGIFRFSGAAAAESYRHAGPKAYNKNNDLDSTLGFLMQRVPETGFCPDVEQTGFLWLDIAGSARCSERLERRDFACRTADKSQT